MITVTDKNRDNIIDRYTEHLLDGMTFQELWNLAYDAIHNSKELMSNEALESEVLDYYPEILEE